MRPIQKKSEKMEELIIRPIAHIKTDFKEKFGIPRQSGRAKGLIGRIVFEPQYREESAFRGLDGFSHLWLIFDFSKAHREGWSPTVRPPRLGGNERVGVFASRSPFRPNPIGLSCVKIIGLEKSGRDGTVILVEGADLLDGTPILDVKPYLPHADCIVEAVGGYADGVENYRLLVEFPQELLEKIPKEKRDGLIGCLADDPRPSYQDDPLRVYSMRFDEFDIKFKVSDEKLTVLAIVE